MIFVLLGAVGIALTAMTLNLRRQAPIPQELEPNLLMTKYPIEFWTGPRTLFHFQDYWHDLPVDLAAHGYEVHMIELAWRDRRARQRQALRRLEAQQRHLVIDEFTAREMGALLKSHPPASVTIVSPPAPQGFANGVCFFAHRLILRFTGSKTNYARCTNPDDLRARMVTVAEGDWTPLGLSS